jgi:hypothetical protein
MTNFDRPGRDPGFTPRVPPQTRSSGSWIAGAIIVVLAILAIGYVFSDRLMGTQSPVEHRAAATDTPAPASPAPTPSATPKP